MKYLCFINIQYSLFFLFLFSLQLRSYGQSAVLTEKLLKFKEYEDTISHNFPAEKLYIQLDKPNYAVGDTVWFKAYLFHAPTLALSAKSGIIYVDIINNKTKEFRQFRLPVKQGLCIGDIALNDFESGNYTLRAFTTWMRNFGSDCFFYKRLFIADDKIINPKLLNVVDRQSPKNSDKKEGAKFSEDILSTDVQFLPEGGSLISGQRSHIGFKALGVDGKGVDISGVIIDSRNKEILSFFSQHLGMGSFDMDVKPGEHYRARVKLPGDIVKEYSFCKVTDSGTMLRIDNITNQDSIGISIAATDDIIKNGNSYFLIGKARNVICYAALLSFRKGVLRKYISKNLFPTGIAHLILMNTNGHPVNERLVFIEKLDNLNIRLSTDKKKYSSHDSVSLQILVTDKENKPIVGNFSLSITDNEKVNIDTLQDNIVTHIFLASELAGNLEQPEYYFKDATKNKIDLDNLLLTQGWVSYDFPKNKNQMVYLPEDNFSVKGKVLRGTKEPVIGASVTLLSSTPPVLLRDTFTNHVGHFSFENLPTIENPLFILQANDRHNKNLNEEIVMDDMPPPRINVPKPINLDGIPPDTALITVARNNRMLSDLSLLGVNGHMLKEVKIKAKMIVKGSQNLNGPGNADIVLNELDIEKEGKTSLLNILSKKIKGFREGTFVGKSVENIKLWSFLHDANNIPEKFQVNGILNMPWYFVNDKPIKLVVDGISIGLINYNISFLDITNYLRSLNAEDIKGIEVNSSSKFTQRYIGTAQVSPAEVGYIEITTRSGHGPILNNTPGVFFYKPLKLSQAKFFYKPRYTQINTIHTLPDLRSTLDWEPNIMTGLDGKATISFYCGDKKNMYNILIEGTDLNSGLGFKYGKIIVSE
ncbi:carboxypeptidase-like regulatory domain-containing protein [Mucilaginibacter lappiensis]|uniref:carboxypeptidase-like regulatory domain-containing protein n=1 Tax=Mucilaginibacter lappiensis TaxID=354630 RepID=UPI0011155EA0|nr:carboxypeptidase-like regulatory domain-containing protein [Mucilaginibacter lappiensis]